MDVIACRAQHRVQAIAERSFQVTTVHAVIALEAPDDQLYRPGVFEVQQRDHNAQRHALNLRPAA